ncbi:hypothetical protein OTU49_017393, partial [Cherax quadricarinatus]
PDECGRTEEVQHSALRDSPETISMTTGHKCYGYTSCREHSTCYSWATSSLPLFYWRKLLVTIISSATSSVPYVLKSKNKLTATYSLSNISVFITVFSLF